MFDSFFIQAAVAPRRQEAFRRAVVAHLILVAGCVGWGCRQPGAAAATLAYALLIAGIVEGAFVIGWRLTQLPKSQALEFLLVSPLRPWRVFLAEALVGLAQLALVTLSGLPILVLLVVTGHLEPLDLVPFLVMPLTWGMVTGLGLIVWAYEPLGVRRWGERGMFVLIVLYLAVGVLAGEHLAGWLDWLPGNGGAWVVDGLEAFHRYNPFAVVLFWLTEDYAATWERMLGIEAAGLAAAGLLLTRAAGRLHGHFQERHYRPVVDEGYGARGSPGERPLSWWAVRRVSEYSGRVNLWLAGGFGILYALYTVAGSAWPPWLGRRIFILFDTAGGVPLWATALIVLAAVPAAFQYGLWDSNSEQRSRRLELLLLTELTAADYWHASWAAAWRRGRGYFAVAGLLWAATALARPGGLLPAIAGFTAGALLWALYFALGFRAFTRGAHTSRLGLALTVGLPAGAFLLQRLGWPALAALTPPGCVYYAAAAPASPAWLLGAALCAGLALGVARRALAACETQLRSWYNLHHGRLVPD